LGVSAGVESVYGVCVPHDVFKTSGEQLFPGFVAVEVRESVGSSAFEKGSTHPQKKKNWQHWRSNIRNI
jgi:hypothetical protein